MHIAHIRLVVLHFLFYICICFIGFFVDEAPSNDITTIFWLSMLHRINKYFKYFKKASNKRPSIQGKIVVYMLVVLAEANSQTELLCFGNVRCFIANDGIK